MRILVKKVQSVQIHSEDAGGLNGGRARTLDVEERRPEHVEGTDQTWTKNTWTFLRCWDIQGNGRKVVIL